MRQPKRNREKSTVFVISTFPMNRTEKASQEEKRKKSKREGAEVEVIRYEDEIKLLLSRDNFVKENANGENLPRDDITGYIRSRHKSIYTSVRLLLPQALCRPTRKSPSDALSLSLT